MVAGSLGDGAAALGGLGARASRRGVPELSRRRPDAGEFLTRGTGVSVEDAAPEPSDPTARRVYSVANVNRGLARYLDKLDQIWVAGDVSELSRNPSWGFVFLTLKDPDEGATLRVTIPRWQFDRTPTETGAHVLVHGRPSVFEPRGELSLRADRIEPTGEGSLLQRIEALRLKLDAEGLFADARKRPLPFWPRAIGVIGGRGAAAPDDVFKNVRARLPGARFVLCETAVQGPAAAPGIVAAIEALDRADEVDVIVLTRGGGSLEDLLAFSDETVCRAIAACSTPIVSAVGHERDTPLCDLVADVRASTPTAAARLIVPDAAVELTNVDRLRSAARRSAERALITAKAQLESLVARPALNRPAAWVESRNESLARARLRLDASQQSTVAGRAQALDALHARLRTISPRATLERGYAIALSGDGRAITNASALSIDETVALRLARGRATARIATLTPDDD